jgi:hypothetical protein
VDTFLSLSNFVLRSDLRKLVHCDCASTFLIPSNVNLKNVVHFSFLVNDSCYTHLIFDSTFTIKHKTKE